MEENGGGDSGDGGKVGGEVSGGYVCCDTGGGGVERAVCLIPRRIWNGCWRMWPGARGVGFRPRGCTALGWMVSEGFELLGLEFEVFAEAYSRVGEQD